MLRLLESTVYQPPIPANEAARLAALRRYEILDTGPEEAYDDIAALAAYIAGTPHALVSLVDADRQWFKSTVNVDIRETERPVSFCATAMLQPETMVIEDASLDARFRDNPLVCGQPGIRFYVGVPLVTSDGFPLGTVCVFDTKPRSLDPEQLDALRALGRQVMKLLELRLRVMERDRLAKVVQNNEKLAALGRLSSVIAHEINNPLAAVGNLIYLARTAGDAAESRGFLEVAERELRRASSVTTQTLRFHRQSSRPTTVRAEELFAATLRTLESRIVNCGVTVEARDLTAKSITCYEGEIVQALLNLVGNAIDAIPAAGGRLVLRGRGGHDWKTGRPGLVLAIADTGAGMSAETQANIFEPFFTTKGMNGNGLGLWITKDILDRHKGTISVRSSREEPHRGTVIRIFLPVDAAPR